MMLHSGCCWRSTGRVENSKLAPHVHCSPAFLWVQTLPILSPLLITGPPTLLFLCKKNHLNATAHSVILKQTVRQTVVKQSGGTIQSPMNAHSCCS